jgi:uncharacterized protein (TIGR02996 family)
MAQARRNAELESIITGDPGNRDAWLVYADWLQERGDPRGRLMAEFARGAEPDELVQHQAGRFLGSVALPGPLSPWVYIRRWRLGFFGEARVRSGDNPILGPEGPVLAEVLTQLLDHPVAGLLESLSLGLADDHDWQPVIDVLTSQGQALGLRCLYIGDYDIVFFHDLDREPFPGAHHEIDGQMSETHIGDLGALWGAFPSLTHLEVQGNEATLGEIAAPELESLIVRCGALKREALRSMERAELPALRHLELWFGDPDRGGDCEAEDLEALLQSEGLPALRSLGLKNAIFTDQLPEMLAASPLLPQLEVLDLSLGTMTHEGAQALIRLSEHFEHLERIDVNDNAIGGGDALRAALPNVELGRQGSPYVSVSE